jgi:aromatic-L-amino-acid decarboxylase
MNADDFRQHGHDLVDWIADYLAHGEKYPVMARTRPGEIRERIPDQAPEAGESMAEIFADFQRDILPGVTHWNHPRFFAYFPANNSGPSILGEMLTACLGVNAMLWQTSPAATELEQQVMRWLQHLLGIPDAFQGVIQDTASTATLCALVCAREKASGHRINAAGLGGWDGPGALRIYASREAHSSVIKGARIAGFGAQNVVSVDIDANRAMDVDDLAARIAADRQAGHTPCAVVATVGTTGCTAVDPLSAIGPVARRHDLWLHVDAALAGTAAILPEKRWLFAGLEQADSLVFNPHKWMFTNFDCSAFYVRDPEHLERTMAIHPEYLKTGRDHEVTNFMDWGIPLGRRFRALKLWFVLRNFGAQKIRAMIAAHLELAADFAGWIDAAPDWDRLAPVPLNTVCFRYRPAGSANEQELAAINQALLERVNRNGVIYLTHTRLDDVFALRLAVGQTRTAAEHVAEAWRELQKAAAG